MANFRPPSLPCCGKSKRGLRRAGFRVSARVREGGSMTFRIFVIAIAAAGTILLGNGANAATPPGAPRPSQHVGNGAKAPVTVVNVYGNNNTIVTDRSVATVGDGNRPNANTGDVSSSGTLGIDDKNSTLQSGTSTNGSPATPTGAGPVAAQPQPPAQAGHASLDPAGSRVGKPRPVRKTRTRATTPQFPIPVSEKGQSTAISGYEDHSVNVSGEDQIAVYDDSNLFVNRNGRLNANTGDTDSSGLNAVDVTGSTVKSGDHNEDGEDGDENSDDNARRADPRPTVAPVALPAAPATPKGQTSSKVTDDGESNATGKNSLTIGADGYDNLGTTVHGKRNIATYDDSNVVTGGTGDVNAQIGDSDTSGAVVMDVHDSNLQSGNST
ncbi:hypothetical protein ACFOY4_03765 [Actinomadura syzygii]|uniref:Uncharacterized protein n=1 Tax=Actinomadura syzygii TaxID=1427538 RepID=A0A5D0TVQ9_9ACTN|nr:hypothetical protein [Actinomadura syzygii]TYC09834.1 hypothetical protein FXF65_32455 [Actinomadura syzygii]